MKYAAEEKNVSVVDEIEESFLSYSLSVISSRAIPDIRDGLKPVQRRILYSMFKMGISPTTSYKKCARVVGDTMGNYHPHGDASIYEALVKMGQPFSKNLCLIDAQGNFGSLDDPPAASRYTECRLSEIATEMLNNIEEDTVDFTSTYDGESTEPKYLPALLPNILVNGVSGIAVGISTNMSPHNLFEVVEVIKALIKNKNKKSTTKSLLKILKGPDFPTGGIIVDEDLFNIYHIGKGSFKLRAKTEIENISSRRKAIVIKELPYLVGPEKVVAKINDVVAKGRLKEVKSVKDLSDRKSGLKIQIEILAKEDENKVLEKLFALTQLEERHSIINIALVDGLPQQLSLIDICNEYINHRLDIILKRSKFRLKKAEDRYHLVLGFLIASANIDEIIKIIKTSKTTKDARSQLCKDFKLSTKQAESILEYRLKKIVLLEVDKLKKEKLELEKKIKYLKEMISSKEKREDKLVKELDKLTAKFGEERKTEIK